MITCHFGIQYYKRLSQLYHMNEFVAQQPRPVQATISTVP
jgi:hypothetical protein